MTLIWNMSWKTRIHYPDIVLNKPVGTSTPTHTSDSLCSSVTPPPSQQCEQPVVNNCATVNEDNVALPGVTTNKVVYQQTAAQDSDWAEADEDNVSLFGVTKPIIAGQQLERSTCYETPTLPPVIEEAATSMANNLVQSVINTEYNIATRTFGSEPCVLRSSSVLLARNSRPKTR